MKIVGLTRVRNESEIILDTLNHMSEFCDEIYVYDDVSLDNTVELCKSHPKVNHVICGDVWDTNRERAEFENREALLRHVRTNTKIGDDDWFIYMDADERIEFDFDSFRNRIGYDVDGIMMRLFDFYITKDDVELHYLKRQWIGPEYRDILFMFKNKSAIGYCIPDQRECLLKNDSRILLSGYVKHYGKSISIEQWEKTCEYYSTHFPKYSKKWNDRKGKAIHVESDFNRPLIKWSDKDNVNLIIRL